MKTWNVNVAGTVHKVVIDTTHYPTTNALVIQLFETNGEPYATITARLDSYGHVSSECSFVDTNLYPWAPDFIEKNGLGEPIGILGYSGQCTYPLYRFHLEKMKGGHKL